MQAAGTDLVAFCFGCHKRVPLLDACLACGSKEVGGLAHQKTLARIEAGLHRKPKPRRQVIFALACFLVLWATGALVFSGLPIAGRLVSSAMLAAFATLFCFVAQRGVPGPPKRLRNKVYHSPFMEGLLRRRTRAVQKRLQQPWRFVGLLIVPALLAASAAWVVATDSESPTLETALFTVAALVWTIPLLLTVGWLIEIFVSAPWLGVLPLLIGAGVAGAIIYQLGLPVALSVALVLAGIFLTACVLDAARVASRRVFERTRKEPFALHSMRCPKVPDDANMVVGIARVESPIESPLSRRPCLAFMLHGRTPKGDVHDASMATFWVTRAEGEPSVRVDAQQAWVEIPTQPIPRSAASDLGLQTFLSRRGQSVGDATLSEGVICDGDRVKVLGELKAVQSTHDYRGEHQVQLMVGSASRPLVIRAE